ncbi:hypothetical protein CK203_042461 [Vitis vinifera]|uniref:Uncharacterized protein n=1 Tax=Vitis vinifera TaxID=29760 RepID=A0A438HER9_VITVI|nr:hypothetical protein CK203_042461 [Vitis vinifera]
MVVEELKIFCLLQGEQLKRRNIIELVDESPAPLLGSTKNTDELKKQDAFKVPRCIDTRMDEEDISAAPASCLKNICVSLNSVVKSHPQLSCPENTVASAAVSKDVTRQDCGYAEKCSQSTFRSVAELSLGSIFVMVVVDMVFLLALKGVVACEPPAFSGLAADSSEKFGNFTSISSGYFCSEFHIPGQKAPLDFTLKTNMQIVFSSSVNCQSTFRSMAELSLGSERISEMAVVDMDKALKGVVACEPRAFSGLAADSSEKFGNFTSISSGNFCSEFHIPGQKAPLDFTLKTNMQIVSSSSVNW